jgi:hypothetical protein
MNRACGGPIAPELCTTALYPSPNHVTVSTPEGKVVAETQADPQGHFSVAVPAGTYLAQASTITLAIYAVTCPAVKVDIVAGNTTNVTLVCDLATV